MTVTEWADRVVAIDEGGSVVLTDAEYDDLATAVASAKGGEFDVRSPDGRVTGFGPAWPESPTLVGIWLGREIHLVRWRCPACDRGHRGDGPVVEEDDVWLCCHPGCGATWEAEVGPGRVEIGLRVNP